MKRVAVVIVIVVGGVIAFAISGSGSVPDAPVTVAWDREVCGHCHMHVGDPRHAAQLITDDGAVVNFDDVGCALRYLEDERPAVHRLWFHGEGDRWIAADQVGFVRGGDSPMGSGLLAVDAATEGAISQAEAARQIRSRAVTYAGQTLAAARLDVAEVLRSRWILFCAGVYAVLAGVLVLVGLRESTLMGFTGMGRVLLGFSHALVLVLPLLALTATGQVVGRARDDGSLELLMSQPIRRSAWLLGVTITRFAVLLAPLVVLVIAMGLYGQARGQEIPWGFVWRVLAISAALLWAFVGIGVAISVTVRNQARAITYVVLTWALSVALLDVGLVGMMLRWRLDPHAVFTIAALNPVQDARLALVSGLDPDLDTLGPVGFYLSTRIGSSALYLLGVVWPAVLGTLAWATALFSFRRGDIT